MNGKKITVPKYLHELFGRVTTATPFCKKVITWFNSNCISVNFQI